MIVPDGRPELIVHLEEPYFEAQTGLQQPAMLFAGQLTRPLKIESRGAASIWGVRFRPDGAYPFLRRSLATTTDQRIPLQDIAEQEHAPLYKALRRAETNERGLAILSAFIAARVGNALPDPLVRALIEQPGTPSPDFAQTDIGIRQAQRRFKRSTGISLRQYRAIRRFRSVFDRLQREQDGSWVYRALETGYFDQPQLARDFQRFLGCCAREWIREKSGLGRALGETAG